MDLKEAKYELESYTYEMKNGVDEYGNYEHYIDPSVRDQFKAQCQEVVDWIYGDGENAPLDQQRSRLQALKTVGDPV